MQLPTLSHWLNFLIMLLVSFAPGELVREIGNIFSVARLRFMLVGQSGFLA